MLIEVLRQTMLAGQVVRVGDVIDASPTDAKLLIGIGKAIAATALVVDAPAPKPSTPRRRAKS